MEEFLYKKNIMKTLREIKLLLAKHKPTLVKKYHINRLGIFGSYVREEQHATSDLDVLIDYDDAPTLLTLIELEYYLSDVIGMKVDLVTTKGIKQQLKERILNEVDYV
ncbi:DNA polymerase beta domain protein region [Candidatus Vecturithrix granuli]|uniref:DNA polymerase beta domain protein region n=1 Tax=Vecturithrix granuli TaxID=1499967 RepID=A0A081C9Q2_VECG1|nr:DNA polymerase beta domain protein region [Candidatus Vecturithrix granuli]